MARCFQAFAECALGEKDMAGAQKWTYQLFKTYPQLIPFRQLKAPVQLSIKGSDAAVIKALKKCNFDFDNTKVDAARAHISFLKKGDQQTIQYCLLDSKGKTIVPEQSFSYKIAEQAGIELAYRICGIGGKMGKK
jgi:hypothetical protein